jgi:hypothetical protein
MNPRGDTDTDADAQRTASNPAGPDDAATGLPWLESWAGVYAFVIGCLVTWVVLLVALKQAFS